MGTTPGYVGSLQGLNTCVYMYIHVHIYIYTYIYMCMNVCMSVCTYVRMYVSMYGLHKVTLEDQECLNLVLTLLTLLRGLGSG